MREQEFTTWLENWIKPRGGHLTKQNFNFYMRNARRIEEVEGVNLDKEFRKDGMASLMELYTYNKDDIINNRPNPTNLNVKPSSLRDYKCALNHYRRFCEKHPT